MIVRLTHKYIYILYVCSKMIVSLVKIAFPIDFSDGGFNTKTKRNIFSIPRKWFRTIYWS